MGRRARFRTNVGRETSFPRDGSGAVLALEWDACLSSAVRIAQNAHANASRCTCRTSLFNVSLYSSRACLEKCSVFSLNKWRKRETSRTAIQGQDKGISSHSDRHGKDGAGLVAREAVAL